MKIIIDTGQDGKVINARVRQKTATLSQWLGKDPVILDGEQAFIIRDDGTPINFRIGDGSKKFSELPDWVAYEQGTYVPVAGSALPTLGAEIRYTWVGPGTYTQSGGPDIVVPSGYMGVLSWDGSVWSLSQSVEMPDNSAKIEEWTAGTYEQNEVVTVDGIIYRALETTNEEPPSDKWEAIGGLGEGFDNGIDLLNITDSDGRVISRLDGCGDKIEYVDSSDDFWSDVYEGEDLFLPEIKFGRIDILGPSIDQSNSGPNTVKLVISANGVELARVRSKISRQGSGSWTWNPSNLTIDIENRYGEDLDIKFGRWPAHDSFQIKSYVSDKTHTRDAGGGRLWREMANTRPYPANLIAAVKDMRVDYDSKEDMFADALFFGDTFPVEVWENGNFRNLGSVKMKKARQNFAINRDNPNHWLFDSEEFSAFIGRGYDWESLNTYYDVKSPRKPSEDTKDAILDWFSWAKNVVDGNVDIKTESDSRLDVISWIDQYIFIQVAWDYDKSGNNILMASYDGGRMTALMHDLDRTFGILDNAGDPRKVNIYETRNGLVSVDPFIMKFAEAFEDDIKIRYGELRELGVISMENIIKIFGGYSAYIPKRVYNLDSKVHLTVQGYPTLDQLYKFANDRIEQLDILWA